MLGRLGLPGGTVRLPQVAPTAEVVDRVLAGVDALGIPAIEGWA